MTPRPSIDHIRRPQILAAAAEVIAERGVAGTRIADVAERCGVSPPAVLYWFDSKEQLLAEALTADDDRFYEELEERLDGATTPGERMVALIESATESADDFSLWMELWTWALRDADLRAARERFDARWRAAIETVVVEGVAAGQFGDAIDPPQAALTIAALIDGLSAQAALGDPEVSIPHVTETVLAGAERLLEAELPARAGGRSSP
ncbi:MAG TPA: TetR family transcriptional regulator C-terminal domain-containing protein [Solirubrobacterales bacterium]|nr:TetR family transcriptional regulator C-terminal domain-containing protein [Solirubrobacterales bacterium]